ncbi:ATP-binding protein [Alkaliphilus transvaalensis]|uniref:ATP-binding protein n=1 Tax=Alkaliphilus transvaalensis TaxID=114628 RepID=UPI000684C637|nr:4Fe-4S dicluster domain-containing protein [Alkaliphilus transvaalensis]
MSKLKRNIAEIKCLRKIFEAKGSIKNDFKKCVYCGLCQKVCSVDAIAVSKDQKTWSIEDDICVRCTHCVFKCPIKALTLQK